MLSKAVKKGQWMISDGEKDLDKVTAEMKALISAEPLARIDYVEAVDAENIKPVSSTEDCDQILVAMAVYVGKTRLIDNFMI